MAITALKNTGFEHGSLVGNSPTGYTAEMHQGLTGTPSLTAGAARNGSFGLHCVAVSNNQRIRYDMPSATQKPLIRIAIKPASAPNADTSIYQISGIVSVILTTAGVLKLSGTNESIGPTLTFSPATWHVVEIQQDGAAGTAYWKVDGTYIGSVTSSTSNSTVCYIGVSNPNTLTIDYDDVIYGSFTVSGSAGDWWGDGKGLAYVPNADGTHSNPADFSTGDAGSAYSNSTPPTTCNTQVNPAGGTAKWTGTRNTTVNLAQRVTGHTSSAYLTLAFPTPGEAGTANAFRAILAYSSSGTQANNLGCVLLRPDGSTLDIIYGSLAAPADYSESTNFMVGHQIPPSGGGLTSLTAALIGACMIRIGGSTDISPVPTVQALMWEVDWPVAAGPKTITAAQDTEADTSTATKVVKTAHPAATAESGTATATKAVKVLKPAQIANPETATAIKVIKTVAVAAVTETDALLRVARMVFVAAAQVANPSTATAIKAIKTAAVAQVTESETVTVVRPARVYPVTQVANPETATVVTAQLTLPAIKVTVDQVSNPESATAIKAIKTATVALISEPETVLSIGKAKTAAVALASDTSVATVAKILKTVAVAKIAQAQSALATKSIKTTAVAKALESDSSTAHRVVRPISVSLAPETDASTPAIRSKKAATAQVTETSTTRGVSVSKHLAVAATGESDASATTRAVRIYLTSKVTETDSSRPLGKHAPIASASESSSATAVKILKVIHVDGLIEADHAAGVGKFIVRDVNRVTETEAATPVGHKRTVHLILIAEPEQALTMTARRSRSSAVVEETDHALAISVIKSVAVFKAIEPDASAEVGIHFQVYIGVLTATDISTASSVTAAKTVRVEIAVETDEPIPFGAFGILKSAFENNTAHLILAVRRPQFSRPGHSGPHSNETRSTPRTQSGAGRPHQLSGRSSPKELTHV